MPIHAYVRDDKCCLFSGIEPPNERMKQWLGDKWTLVGESTDIAGIVKIAKQNGGKMGSYYDPPIVNEPTPLIDLPD